MHSAVAAAYVMGSCLPSPEPFIFCGVLLVLQHFVLHLMVEKASSLSSLSLLSSSLSSLTISRTVSVEFAVGFILERFPVSGFLVVLAAALILSFFAFSTSFWVLVSSSAVG